MKPSFVLILFCCFVLHDLSAQRKRSAETPPPATPNPMQSSVFNGLAFRSIGPALVSGRISDLAVNPQNHSEYYIAAASGGVWKTVNAGTTFAPVFDDQGSFSIGCIAIDPNNTNVIWVGTGENNNQRVVGYGDGIYRSDDGGKSWKNMGLKNSEHIGRIAIDPDNSDIIYVAAYGPVWSSGGERGIYKTTDGGKTWKPILTVSEHTSKLNEKSFRLHLSLSRPSPFTIHYSQFTIHHSHSSHYKWFGSGPLFASVC